MLRLVVILLLTSSPVLAQTGDPTPGASAPEQRAPLEPVPEQRAPLEPTPEQLVREAVLRALEARAPARAGKMDVSVIRPGIDAPVTGAVSVELPAQPPLPRGRLQVAVLQEGIRAGWAMVEIAHFDSVATLTTAHSSGDAVDAASVRFVWMEVTRFSGDPLSPSVLAGWGTSDLIASRSLSADRPLRSTDVGPRPAAEAGDPIRMTYRRAGFLLEVNCRSRDRGQIGDIIRLYADDSNTMYRARLLGNGRAEWMETL